MRATMTPGIAGTGAASLRVAILAHSREVLDHARDALGGNGGGPGSIVLEGGAQQVAAVVEQEHPELLILEAAGASEAELEALERTTLRHPGMEVILLCARQSPAFLLRALRIGVRDVLQVPVTREGLCQAIDRARDRLRLAKAPPRQGKVLAFLPCKGGSGATFLAANLAYALAREGPQVALIDLNLHSGDAAVYLSEGEPPSTLADLARQIQRLDSAFLDSSMIKVLPNFGVLAAPDSAEQAMEVHPEHVERLLAVAKGCCDYIVLDAGRALDAVSIKALDHAEAIYLVLQPSLPFLRDARRLVHLFHSLGYPASRLRLIVNRYEKAGELSLADVERAVGLAVFRAVPNSFRTVAASINQGTPIFKLAARDPVAKAIAEMALREVSGSRRGGSWLRQLLGAKEAW